MVIEMKVKAEEEAKTWEAEKDQLEIKPVIHAEKLDTWPEIAQMVMEMQVKAEEEAEALVLEEDMEIKLAGHAEKLDIFPEIVQMEMEKYQLEVEEEAEEAEVEVVAMSTRHATIVVKRVIYHEIALKMIEKTPRS